MIAKIAYLTTPAPGRFVLNIQPENVEGILRFEITKAHLANIIIDGASWSLRETSISRVPAASHTESAHEPDRRQLPA